MNYRDLLTTATRAGLDAFDALEWRGAESLSERAERFERIATGHELRAIDASGPDELAKLAGPDLSREVDRAAMRRAFDEAHELHEEAGEPADTLAREVDAVWTFRGRADELRRTVRHLRATL